MVFITVGLSMAGVLVWKFQRETERKRQIEQQIQTIPNVQLKTMNFDVFDLIEFANDKPLLIIYFNSTCEICRLELNNLKKRLDDFVGVNILLASLQEKKELEAFIENFRCPKLPILDGHLMKK